MDPPAGPDPVRDPGLPGARRPARRRSGRCPGPARPRPRDLRRSPGFPQGTGPPRRGTRRARRSDWHCVLAGSLDRDPDFVEQLRTRISRLGYDHRVRLSGVLIGAALSQAYATADLLVAPSRSETYGMTVTEALAHGLPVIAAAVGGLPEAL